MQPVSRQAERRMARGTSELKEGKEITHKGGLTQHSFLKGQRQRERKT